MKLNGKEYPTPQLNTFKDIMEYEAKGVNILGLSDNSFWDSNKPITSIITAISFLTGLSLDVAADEFQAEVESGSNLSDLADRILSEVQKFQEGAENSGFLSEKKKPQPQDHKKKTTKKSTAKSTV